MTIDKTAVLRVEWSDGACESELEVSYTQWNGILAGEEHTAESVAYEEGGESEVTWWLNRKFQGSLEITAGTGATTVEEGDAYVDDSLAELQLCYYHVVNGERVYIDE